MKRFPVLLLLVGVICGFTHDLDANTIKIGIADDPEKKPHYQPLIEHLDANGLGTFDFIFFDTVDDLYTAFQNKIVRLALFGPVFYTKVHKETGAIPIVKDEPNASVIFVRRDSEIQGIKGLRGHKFAFGYYESTTSSMIPRMVLWRELEPNVLVADEAALQRDPDKIYFAQLDSHHAVIESVVSGEFDAGATVDVFFERNKHRGLRSVYTSEPYPGVPLVCHNDESQEFVVRMRGAFLSYAAPENSPHHHFKAGASAASDEDYAAVRYLCSSVLRRDYD